jgi:predicted lipoprotein with Yx(FWY)xxD motif
MDHGLRPVQVSSWWAPNPATGWQGVQVPGHQQTDTGAGGDALPWVDRRGFSGRRIHPIRLAIGKINGQRGRKEVEMTTRESSSVFRRRVAIVLASTSFTAFAAACSGGSATSTSAPVPTSGGGVLTAQPTSLGTILVDGKGRTVYEFANDKNGASTCTGGCAANWPFVAAPATLPASLPGVTGQLGTTMRSDGARQVTVGGHPVYTFAGDSAPGQTNGQGVVLDGGLWTAASPAGAPITSAGPGAGQGLGY